jgi:glycosyltransferase involved in cell wall biosynthesis
LKCLLLANTDWYLFNFRHALASSIRRDGHEVLLVSPPGPYGPKLLEAGFKWIPFDFHRQGMNPLRELITLKRLIFLYRAERPDLVHHFTIKCVLYGGLAARLTGVPARVASITGLGHMFMTSSPVNQVLRTALGAAYRSALAGGITIFQNRDDLDYFIKSRLVKAHATQVISGSGVDTDRFTPAESEPPYPITFIMVSRLLAEKGVREFLSAARIVRAARPDVRCQIVGDADRGNPSSLTSQEVADLQTNASVEWLGHRDDLPVLLRAAHVAVLPSYREGTPRSLLEAAACGLPIVATDVPGCREIARQGYNALLCPPRDPNALAAAMLQMAADADMRREYGLRSRGVACSEFRESEIVGRTKSIYQKIWGQ